MGKNLNGKEVAEGIRKSIQEFTEDLKAKGKPTPSLLSIKVGEDEGSDFYINNQKKLSEKLGINFVSANYPETIMEEELIERIKQANENNDIHGIIVQLPLPKSMNVNNVISAISYKKDVDGQSEINISKLYKDEKSFVPCTAESVLTLIKTANSNIQGKRAVVIGRSTIVGKPVAHLLLRENATVTICHSRTQDLKAVCREADILVSAIGKPKFVNREFIKKDAIVIDVGTSSVNGKITGDVDYEDVIDEASFITPVPGGVGALTTTLLLYNVCEAYKNHVY
ncbi:methylenetetrahydrofolate dehydrogenase (NADP+) / methenyltetrahydrofolate cyclohydrolase [Clostridium amylolyticum]|uniref:Bifunctional protein FolD n=1 Tax=Clostridium amylolyticum TaxID=1121298 RepID=A0A1M6KH96_9CLOT|nr:tetrahydrofolate dehydrogenase/cyclohydrolase catalytic domain-containing protein [Clostridium amylolyticum]SHJ58289.1 methylenetetrahydrofolate dehydrogenase (NADP+) / methenyltetrahydrofolate cyclohydrolase [Clostridium amylolyticum]